jgi:RNase P subunit RPR2
MGKPCIKCGSLVSTVEYRCRIWRQEKEWLQYSCVQCEYEWKEPTLDNKEEK